MYKGDISNEVVARLVIVFEGLLGILPDVKAKAAFDKAMKRGKWSAAAHTWEINELVARNIWDLTYRLNYNLDVVTYLGVEFADELRTRLQDDEGLPISRVFPSTPNRFARELSYRPDIATVYDSDTSRVFTYGSKGQIISPYQPRFR